ncbi:MAG TPA: septum formation initiator family protein [Alphaproteobacteria bacterium]|jgi:cell division protein FtsB|nr:septum formation initiator family protein [Alphaproteobacteria bacterium]
MKTKIISFVLWIAFGILCLSTIRNLTKVFQTRSDIQKEKNTVLKMKSQNEELESQLVQAQSLSFIEKQVRDKLGLAKAGESIVILPDEDTLRKLAPQLSVEENTLPDPNWKKWEKLFF